MKAIKLADRDAQKGKAFDNYILVSFQRVPKARFPPKNIINIIIITILLIL